MVERFSVAPDAEKLRFHYELELELADRLRVADREERKRLFPIVYDELHAKVPYLLYIQDDPNSTELRMVDARSFNFLRKFLKPDTTYLEIGPGGCKLARKIAEQVRTVYAVDVSESAMHSGGPLPANLIPIVSDGTNVPVPANSVDVAYSANLIEHLHPDDAAEQLGNVLRSLKPGEVYFCKTPNRINGPHDVSVHFGHKIAAGFHLKEYAYTDIIPFFRSVGFEDICGYVDLKGRVILRIPGRALIAFEWLIEHLPRRQQSAALGFLPVKAMLQVLVCGRKPA